MYLEGHLHFCANNLEFPLKTGHPLRVAGKCYGPVIVSLKECNYPISTESVAFYTHSCLYKVYVLSIYTGTWSESCATECTDSDEEENGEG